MKAIIWTKYGNPDVLQLREIEKPTPKDNEILIRVHAATVTAGDCEIRRLKFPFYLKIPMRIYIGLLRPTRVTVLGQELAGQIEAVGKDVKNFKPGDAVFGTPSLLFGAYAEYMTLPEKNNFSVLAPKPENLSYAEAAGLTVGAVEALYSLRIAQLKEGEHLLINGAGGSIGTMAVQLARHLGARVSVVDSGEKLALLTELGAQHVFDYTRDDFTRSDSGYDVIFDVVGKSPYARSIKALNNMGRYIIANPRMHHHLRKLWFSRPQGKQVITGTAAYKLADLLEIKQMVEAGILKVVIDRSYPLAETAEAHRYVESGQKQGNVIITIAE